MDSGRGFHKIPVLQTGIFLRSVIAAATDSRCAWPGFFTECNHGGSGQPVCMAGFFTECNRGGSGQPVRMAGIFRCGRFRSASLRPLAAAGVHGRPIGRPSCAGKAKKIAQRAATACFFRILQREPPFKPLIP